MLSSEIRKKFLDFYAKKGHAIIPGAPLVLDDDTTTLFTSSGMQPLVPYLLGEPHPLGKRLVDFQPSLRLEDIEEVGDNRHTTFFEMLGNWSLGDYFKAEQLPWFLEFLTKELGLEKDRLWISVFEGDKAAGVPRDEESFAIWKKLGISEERIFFYGVKENWWSRSGVPQDMPVGEIGGPDSEVFYEFLELAHNPAFGNKCHPNCDCGRFLEIGNSVFIQYRKMEDGSLQELSQKNVDFGGGLERLAAATENKSDIFQTDLFLPVIDILQKLSKREYTKGGREGDETRVMRIIADHLRASVMLVRNGVSPSNKTHGYVLRRLLRRTMLVCRKLNLSPDACFFENIVKAAAVIFESVFPDIKEKEQEIASVFCKEGERFNKALERGLKEIEKAKKLDGKTAFYLYESFGFPLEMIIEIAKERNQSFNIEDFKIEQERHQELSRQGAEGMFKGGLADQSYEVVKLHTATHLLHRSLRSILGDHVRQEGSNITAERLRFDFSHPQKLTPKELIKVEDLVNEKIKQDLKVSFEIMDRDLAIKSGAVAFFKEKYADKIKVYTIGPSIDSGQAPSARSSNEAHSKSSGPPFSREICNGPHAKNTGELGKFKIAKEEAVGSGVRRIKAILINK